MIPARKGSRCQIQDEENIGYCRCQNRRAREKEEQKQNAVKSTIVFTTMIRDIKECEVIRKLICSTIFLIPFCSEEFRWVWVLGWLRLKECLKRSFPTSFVRASG